jgi:hypothetical protein
MVHVDNVLVHNSRMMRNFFEDNPLVRLPDPPYSLEVSPSDFCIFGKIKGALIGQEIHGEIRLLAAVAEIVTGFRQTSCNAFFAIGLNALKMYLLQRGAMHPSKSPACHYLM